MKLNKYICFVLISLNQSNSYCKIISFHNFADETIIIEICKCKIVSRKSEKIISEIEVESDQHKEIDLEPGLYRYNYKDIRNNPMSVVYNSDGDCGSIIKTSNKDYVVMVKGSDERHEGSSERFKRACDFLDEIKAAKRRKAAEAASSKAAK